MNDLPFDPEDQHLQPSWLALERRFRDAAWVQPERGFSRRWLQKWQLAEQRKQKRRAIWLGIADGSVTLALFILLLPWVLPTLVQPVTAFVAQINALIGNWTILTALLDALTHVAQAVPLVALLALIGTGMLAIGATVLLFNRMNLIKEK